MSAPPAASPPAWKSRARSWLSLLRHLPAYARFLPFLLRPGAAEPPREQAGARLTPNQRAWLAAQARRTPDGAVLLQAEAGPPEVEVTCALARGCRGSRRRVYVWWPEGDAWRAAFRRWHQTVIRQGLAPYVTAVPTAGQAAQAVDLLYGEAPEGWRLNEAGLRLASLPPD